MVKLIKKILFFILVISIVTITINSLYIRQHKTAMDKFSFIPDTIQICNFGSSHGYYGFNYEDLKNYFDCFNFGLESQSLSYDYRLFQYYSDHIDEGAVIFIPVSYFSLFGTEESSRNEFLAKNKRYYSILPASLIKEYDYKTAIYVRYLPSLASGTDDAIKTLLGQSNNEDWQRATTDIEASESAEKRFYDHIGKQAFYNANGDRIENQEEIDALYALVKGCQEKGAVPILITTPFLHEYTDEVKENSPDFYDHFYSVIDQVVRDTGVEYYYYAFDERFVNNYSWFINIDHLNKEGARNFVDILMQEIVYAKGYF